MGMMSMAPMPQVEQLDNSAPMPQGMMTDQPQGASPTLSHGRFNGVVTVEGQPIEVKAGVAQVEGQPYMVSDDGKLVVDGQARLIGHIENGQFIVVTPEYHDQMMKAGFIQ